MIKEKHIYKEVLHPAKVEKEQEPPMLLLIYRAVYMCLRLLIDIRKEVIKGEKYEQLF